MKKESKNKILIVTVFAIAMGFLETAVVLYLRKLYYPTGFAFPLKGFIDPAILGIEWIREFSTIIMLLCLGYLVGKKAYEKFAYFLYAFAIWDIFYYVFLKAVLNWPESFLTGDILFMVPWPWVGPVITPLLCSLLMIAGAFLIIKFQDEGRKTYLDLTEWILLGLGGSLILYTWLSDYFQVIISGGFAKDFFTLANNPQLYNLLSSYIPANYNWQVYILGITLSAIAVIKFYARIK